MSNELQKLLSYIPKVGGHRWLVLVTAIVICAIGWPIVLVLPDQYEVTAKVYLNTQTVLKPLLRGLAVDSSTTQQTAMVLRRTLLSRPNMEKVARATGMDLKVSGPERYERLLKDLADEIKMDGGGTEQIYTISYRNKDPRQAKQVVQEVLSLFVEGALGETRQDNTSTKQFLNEQIARYEVKLESAENKLKEFKRKNVGLMPGEGQTYFTQLSASTDQLNSARLELSEAIKRRDELSKQIADIKDPSKLPSSPRSSPLQAKLNELLLNYTENHPDVIALKRLIAQQEGLPKNELSDDSETDQSASKLRGSFAYQELKVALGKAEADVAALTVRVKEREAIVNKLQKLIDTIPQVEAELKKMNRDYNIIKDNYEEMVRRRERAKITYEAEKSIDDVQFKIIDPPRVPLLPVGPKRLILLTAVLGLGAGGGLGSVLLLIQIRPTFDTWQDLREATTLPVFGSVSLIHTSFRGAKNQIQNASFWSVLGLWIISFIALASMQVLHINLSDLVQL
jgi:polysaccharide chain length determinant protein (PEP-CTERM system associated)